MKKFATLLLVLLLFVSVSVKAEPLVINISVDSFVQRYNEFTIGFFKAFKQNAEPVEAVITEADGVVQFTISFAKGSIDGKAVAGQVIEVDALIDDLTGSLLIMGAVVAVSSMQNVMDAMDPLLQAKHITEASDNDLDIALTNGYVVEIVERFKSGEAKHAVITLLP